MTRGVTIGRKMARPAVDFFLCDKTGAFTFSNTFYFITFSLRLMSFIPLSTLDSWSDIV
jgi:hypothetical protein